MVHGKAAFGVRVLRSDDHRLGAFEIAQYDRMARRLDRINAVRCCQGSADASRIPNGLHPDDLAKGVVARLDGGSRGLQGRGARDLQTPRRILDRASGKELGLKGTSPEGAFYTMLDIRPLGMSDLEVAEKFLQNRVITVPGIAFGSEAKGFLRISFCNNEERMAEGVRRMKEALG
ncbi:MAG: aminotransferase class I/II-fold pyridoxal phosphate-dependent enzyme [Acidobacteria bacterium]|nr:aminotransferase class I/II-fold pyridoxal phosphate-dependent enzyme [Acidobacteriota bacterium]